MQQALIILASQSPVRFPEMLAKGSKRLKDRAESHKDREDLPLSPLQV